MRQNALMLIELLVSIAIVATLAALLFPVFSAAREKGHATLTMPVTCKAQIIPSLTVAPNGFALQSKNMWKNLP